MKQIDRLFGRAMKLRKSYDDVIIISNKTGKWMIEDREFPNLESAERAVDGIVRDEHDVLVIINDVGPGDIEKDVIRRDRDKTKDRDTDRDKKNTLKGDKHDRKQENGRKDSEYRHTWV